jgi:hypothetical protein
LWQADLVKIIESHGNFLPSVMRSACHKPLNCSRTIFE